MCGESGGDGPSLASLSSPLGGLLLAARIEAIVARKLPAAPHCGVCCQCLSLLQQIYRLEVELLESKRSLATMYSSTHPGPRASRKAPGSRKTQPGPSSTGRSSGSLPSVSMGEPLDFSEPVIDAKMPLQVDME